MTQHTSTLWLPDALNELGVLAVTLDGWDTAQGNYLFTDPMSGHQGYDEDPSCFMIHHTAGKTATPVVKNSSGDWSKANVWAGLWDGRKLYQEPGSGRVPALVFTSAGPARTSSGYGHWPTAVDVFNDQVPPWKQTGPDEGNALNRYTWNVETVASGDGSPVDPGVEDALIVMGVLLAERYGWNGEARTIGHITWTGRKIDPYWNGERNRIEYLRSQVGQRLDQVHTQEIFGMPYEQFANLVDALFIGRPDKFHGDPAYFYTKSGPDYAFDGYPNGGIYDVPDSPDWPNFWRSYVETISLTS